MSFDLAKMGSAQRDTMVGEGTESREPARAIEHGSPSEWREQVAARLKAHREGRGQGSDERLSARGRTGEARHTIAAAVAERFAQTPSYRAVLAEEAQRAVDQAAREAEQAAAEAEIAARNAQAVAHTQRELLDALELWNGPQQVTTALARTPKSRRASAKAPDADQLTSSTPVREVSAEGLTVRLYEDIARTPRTVPPTHYRASASEHDLDEAQALDEEIAFRQAPVFEPFLVEPTLPLPANLLEFPRQLIAARKARPRLAEGPLRQESTPTSPQLRIFEVEPEQISTTPAALSVTPEWATIRLDAHTITETVNDPPVGAPALLPSMLPPQTAPLRRRVAALLVDCVLVGGAFAAFAAAAARVGGSVPSGMPAVAAAAGMLGFLFVLYELLFFTLSDQTPGMRCARIGLCTFTDENPSRAAIRRRILAQLIALCPLGIGLLWALLDDDGLGWHDRISRMYQRAY